MQTEKIKELKDIMKEVKEMDSLSDSNVRKRVELLIKADKLIKEIKGITKW